MKSFLLMATRTAPSSSILTTPYCRWAQPVGPPRQQAQEKSATGERLFGLCSVGGVFLANLIGEARSSGEQRWVTE